MTGAKRGSPGRTGGGAVDAWLFVRGESVPQRWRSRAISVSLIPLLPSESETLLATGTAEPALEEEDMHMASVVARGSSLQSIAREMSMSLRTVQRKLAQLEQRLGVSGKRELQQLLRAGGFGFRAGQARGQESAKSRRRTPTRPSRRGPTES